MNDSTERVTGGGVTLSGLLFIAFLVLKLTKVIDWSWWWVCAPLWIPAGIVILIMIGGAVLSILSIIVKGRAKRSRNRKK